MTWINFTETPINPFALDRHWKRAGVCLEPHGWGFKKYEDLDYNHLLYDYTYSKEGFPIIQYNYEGIEDFDGTFYPEVRETLRLFKDDVDQASYSNPSENVSLQMLFPNPYSGEPNHYDTETSQRLCKHWTSFTDQYFALAGSKEHFDIDKGTKLNKFRRLRNPEFVDERKFSPAFQAFFENALTIFEDKGQFMLLFPKEQLHFVISELFRPGVHANFYIFPFHHSTENITQADWFALWNKFKVFFTPPTLDIFRQVVKEFTWLLTTHNNHPYLKPLCFYVAPNVSVLPSEGLVEWQHFKDMYTLLNKFKDLQAHHHPPCGIYNVYSSAQLNKTKELTLTHTNVAYLEDLKQHPNITSLTLYRNFVWNLGNALSQLTHLKRLTLGQMSIYSYDFLAGMTSLEYLKINHMNYPGVLKLPVMPQLKELDLATTSRLGENGKLRAIELVASLENLKTINLDSTAIKDLSFTKKCPALEKLVLNGIPVDDLSILKDLPTLRSLSLAYMGTLALPNLPQLEHLELTENDLESLQNFFHLPALKHLVVRQNNLNNLNELAHFPTLEYLDITNNPVKSLEGLPELPQLHTLLLNSFDIKNYAPLLQRTFPKLSKLQLWNLDSLKHIQHFKTLEYLDISVLEENYSLLATFPQLKQLHLENLEVEKTNFKTVRLPQLVSLNLDGSKFTDLQFLKNFRQLKELSLGNLSGSDENTPIDLSDLKEIALPHLTTLNIRRTLPQDWQPLLALKSLEKIIVTSRIIPKEIIQQFEETGVVLEDNDIW